MRHGVIRCPACGLWSRWGSARLEPVIDRKCIKCEKRTRAKLDRKGRGRPRATEVRELPGHMPPAAIYRMLRELNQWERRGRRKKWILRGGKEDGFIPASKILSEKGERTRTRNLSDPEWEGILDQLTREVSESENEMS